MFKVSITNNPKSNQTFLHNGNNVSINVCGNYVKADLRKKIEKMFTGRSLHIDFPNQNSVDIITDNESYFKIIKDYSALYLRHIYN